jgi:hypothetical protein
MEGPLLVELSYTCVGRKALRLQCNGEVGIYIETSDWKILLHLCDPKSFLIFL